MIEKYSNNTYHDYKGYVIEVTDNGVSIVYNAKKEMVACYASDDLPDKRDNQLEKAKFAIDTNQLERLDGKLEGWKAISTEEKNEILHKAIDALIDVAEDLRFNAHEILNVWVSKLRREVD